MNKTVENLTEPKIKRLYSLDALRGFDMFWIMGGGSIFIGLATLTGWPVFQWWANQLHHVAWHGFHFLDMIFPLFLFIAGISFPFSLAKCISMNDRPLRKVLYLVLSAIALIIIGMIWNIVFPINKNLWSGSFVCFVSGLSLLLFAMFYLIIDVWQYKKRAFFFVVIGVNPITIYLAGKIINFRSASNFFFGGITALLPNTWEPFISGIGITTIGWVFLFILYKKKIFLKV
jgi:predicted acyltransferase